MCSLYSLEVTKESCSSKSILDDVRSLHRCDAFLLNSYQFRERTCIRLPTDKTLFLARLPSFS